MFRVELLNFCGLTEEEQSKQSDNGNGKEYASYIRVIHNGKTIAVKSDAMEPEDCCFLRDLNWVTGLLIKCYTLGLSDT